MTTLRQKNSSTKIQEVTIQVLPETAYALINALKGATKDDQERLNFLIKVWAASLKETQPINELMDSVSDIAQASGLTPDKLNAIINE
ncbi:MAG: hypothetical protein HQK91_02500 [Nitrospirae bacterium]|nr:hypothetical protein [Nitrospirota bacterium]MBF0540305.1 hypothetical protein [Nitrospirota bacterium]